MKLIGGNKNMENKTIRRKGQFIIEINNHMARAKSAASVGAPFMVDEYCCLICNTYFRTRIYESDLQVIKELIQFFGWIGSTKNSLILVEILKSTENLKVITENFCLESDFLQVLSDDLKSKLRDLYKTKRNKDSQVHDIEGEYFDDFYAKYSRDLDYHWARIAQRFNFLKLKKPSRILDIGCGFGILSHIATFNGHTVDSIDIPNVPPICKAATKLLKIKKYDFSITKNTPFLKLKHKYDVVTAFQICFNGSKTKNLWDVDEWKYFLLDLHDNILNDGGLVNLIFNWEHINFKPIIVDGERVFLGKKSVEDFFKPFFFRVQGMPQSEEKKIAILTKKNIKDACQTNRVKKYSYSIGLEQGKYGR